MALNLFEQKYIKPSRTITGLLNTQFRDDVLIFCNTTSGAVAITLLGIPNGNWSTEQKLYIIDSGNNATTNNITINCPSGFTINGQSSFVINSNGGSLVVRPVSNTNYIGQYSVYPPIPPVYYQTIQDEGTSLTPRQKVNYTGTGVTATDDPINNATIVNISGFTGAITKTYAEMTILVGSNSLVAGQTYYIIDGGAIYVSNGILVVATSTNKLSLTGQCLNYNADYQGVGNYTTSPIPYVNNLGVWAGNLPGIVIGSVVVFNNNNYISITGVNTATEPNSDAVNWQLLSKSGTTGYILEVDEVGYDFTANKVIWRRDKRGNYVECISVGAFDPIVKFQWGKNDCTENTIIGLSLFSGTNSRMPFNRNIITNSSYSNKARYNINQGNFNNNVLTNANITLGGANFDIFGEISYNRFVGDGPGLIFNLENMASTCILSKNFFSNVDCNITQMQNNAEIRENQFLGCLIVIGTIDSTYFGTNIVCSGKTLNIVSMTSCFLNCNTFDAPISFNTINNYFDSYKYINDTNSSFFTTLDLNDATIYNNITKKLTLPQNRQFCGQFELTNCAGKTIEFIEVDSIYPRLRTYFPTNADTIDFKHTAVAGATNFNLLCDAGASTNILVGRQPGSDYIEYKLDRYAPTSTQLFLRNNLVKLA